MTVLGERGSYRWGVAAAAVTSLLTVWTTIVRDDSTGEAYFMILLAVAVGWFAAGFRAVGMARAMAGVAVMQLLNGALIATAPITAEVADGPARAMIFNAAFAGFWLVSAAFFRSAAKRDLPAAPDR